MKPGNKLYYTQDGNNFNFMENVEGNPSTTYFPNVIINNGTYPYNNSSVSYFISGTVENDESRDVFIEIIKSAHELD